MSHTRRIRIAAILVALGLLIELVSFLHWVPLAFVLFVLVGAPLVLAGVVLYGLTVWRILRERDAL